VFNAIRVSCPDGACQITRGVTSAKVRGQNVLANSIFTRGRIPEGKRRIIKIKLPSRRVWRNLRPGVKSGAAVISVTVRSNNGLRTTESFRIGLKR
jgi:hypothetical protein